MTWFDWLMYVLVTASMIVYSLSYMDEKVTKPLDARVHMLEVHIQKMADRIDKLEKR